jgi:hypothetical protein
MMTDFYVEIIESKTNNPFRVKVRKQPWFWRLVSNANGRTLAWSGERYTNKGDCIDSARLVNGQTVSVALRQEGKPEERLRDKWNIPAANRPVADNPQT